MRRLWEALGILLGPGACRVMGHDTRTIATPDVVILCIRCGDMDGC